MKPLSFGHEFQFEPLANPAPKEREREQQIVWNRIDLIRDEIRSSVKSLKSLELETVHTSNSYVANKLQRRREYLQTHLEDLRPYYPEVIKLAMAHGFKVSH